MLALATQVDLPDWEVDDRPFHAALTQLGIEHVQVPWTDPDVDWSRFDAVLIRTTWDYAGQREAFVTWARRVAEQTQLFNPPEVIVWNTDKHYLRDLERAGVAIAPTEWLEQGTSVDVAEVLQRRGWERGFIKPIFGQTARETLRFDRTPSGIAAAQAHCDRLLPEEGLMMQPYLAAVETVGEHSAIVFQGRVSHVVQKIPVPGDYRVMDDYGASDRPSTLDAAGRDLCERAVAAVPHPTPLLYARVDLLHDNDGNWVLTELELVEPSLFFRHDAGSADTFARAVAEALGRTSP